MLWNAYADQQVDIIYKVTNQTDALLAEGVVRTYEDNLFVGSDFIELTPVGSEGSVTVGHLQDVRVNRTSTRTHISEVSIFDTNYDVSLVLNNFGTETIILDVVDRYPADSTGFIFSTQPELQGK